MNILRLSTLSMTLAIAVITLGVGANGWAAPGDCTGKKSDRDPECNVDDPPETTFTGDIVVTSNLTASVICTGTTGMGLDVGFPLDNCPVTLADDRFPPRPYCLFAADVKNTRKETSVMFFFHEPCGDHPGDGVWRTLRLPATVVVGGPGNFTVTEVNGSFQNVELKKNHQPFKEEPLSDKFSVVGGIVYTEELP